MKYLTIILLFISSFAFSQEYVEMLSKDDITIEYKWRKKDFLKKDSPYVLYLKITNNGFEQMLVNFELIYYWNLMPHSHSGVLEYCIKPGKTIKGKRWDLVFQSEIKTLREIHDRQFKWDIVEFEANISENCNSGLKLKVEPAHQMSESKNEVSVITK